MYSAQCSLSHAYTMSVSGATGSYTLRGSAYHAGWRLSAHGRLSTTATRSGSNLFRVMSTGKGYILN